jgi:hypothetical protein
MNTIDFNEVDKKEWRELGFFYDRNDQNKKWFFHGSKIGLINFIQRLIEYIKNPNNTGISEHEHFGPYQYLKLITWNEPKIDKQGIYGSIEDISRFASIISDKIKTAKINEEIIIDKEYSNNNDYKLIIKIMPDDFDPASLDKILI